MNILGLDSSNSIGFDLTDIYNQRENTTSERGSQDTVSISEEARVLFMQLQEANASTDNGAEKDDAESSTAQEFKNVLNSHKPGGSGGGSAQSSSEDAIEDVISQIKQVSSELASVSSKAGTQSDGGESSSRVQQLKSQLGQLESLLAELEAAAEEGTS